jgi:hypothetical protein
VSRHLNIDYTPSQAYIWIKFRFFLFDLLTRASTIRTVYASIAVMVDTAITAWTAVERQPDDAF